MDTREWVDRLFRINLVQVGLNFVLTLLIAGWVFYPQTRLENPTWDNPGKVDQIPEIGMPAPRVETDEPQIAGGDQDIPRPPGESQEAVIAPPPEQDKAAQTPVANYLRDVIAQLDTGSKTAGLDLRGYLPSREERMAAEGASDVSDPAVQKVLARLAKGYTRLGQTMPGFGSSLPADTTSSATTTGGN